MATEAKPFDVILLGATGFTGRLVADYLYQTYGLDGDLKWAIAGRSLEKLNRVAAEVAVGEADTLPCLVADSRDEDSLAALVTQAKVICTTVGPYALYGSELVRLCAEHGVHYCDLTGEVHWMRRMIDAHQSAAEASGARIVHTCGFDSIPSDLGVYCLQQHMLEKHGVPATEVKCRIADTSGGVSGGTVASMMNMMEEARHDPTIGEVLADPYGLNPLNMPRGPDGPDQTVALYDLDFQQWTAPFVMSSINTRVVRRSNALMNYAWGKDFRYTESMLMGNGPTGYMKAAAVAGASSLTTLMAAIDPVRTLLGRMLPAPGEGPSKETRENGFFTILLHGRHPEERAKDLRIKVTGDKDPGYGATSKMLAESAVCLALDELDSPGGITTPAVAMGSSLIKRLGERAGMTFELVS